MKKLSIIVTLLAVTASCTSGKDVGVPFCSKGQTPAKNHCQAGPGFSVPSTPRASTTKPVARSTRPIAQSTKPIVRQTQKPFEHTIVVRGSSGGYQYDPDAVIVYVGDILHFKDLDPSPPSSDPSNQSAPHGHTFTSNPAGQFDSGIVGSGKTWDFKVNLPIGRYNWHCTVVPYMGGGPLDVRARPK